MSQWVPKCFGYSWAEILTKYSCTWNSKGKIKEKAKHDRCWSLTGPLIEVYKSWNHIGQSQQMQTVKRTNQNAKSAGCIFLRADTKTSLMSLANRNRCRKSNESIRMPSQLAKFSHALIQEHLRSQAREKSAIFVYRTSDNSKKWYNILFIHKRLKVTHISLFYKSLFQSLQTK